jgi:succinate-semialdehyde dehydrogenase/glutarate-semialdehyde dehydrogenase
MLDAPSPGVASKFLHGAALIGARWIAPEEAACRIAVEDPATLRPIAAVPDLGADAARAAIDAAEAAATDWAARTGRDRARMLRRWHDAMLAEAEPLARLLTAEQGKPLAEARAEIAYAASFVEWFAEEAPRIEGEVLAPPSVGQRLLVIRRPVGIVAAVTPWNFPAAMVTRKLAPALAAGCTVVLKPSELTPLTALALARLALEAGIPPGVLNVVTGAPAPIGAVLLGDPRVRKLSFTGSTAVGKRLAAEAAGTVKRVSLELGGNAPLIVFADADLDQAVDGAMASKFRNTGQTCVCANRILVEESVHDAFVERLAARIAALRVGHGLASETDQGPLINDAAVAKVCDHLEDALRHGARLALGGRPHRLGGRFWEPTLLLDATPAMRLATEETFGPVAPVFRFRGEEQAIALANATASGLAAYAFTRDLDRSFRLLERLAVGMVGMNSGVISTAVAPFGGVKESGFGREGSRHGIQEYLDMRFALFG